MNVLTDEEAKALQQRVWAKMHEDISKQVEYTLTQELASGYRTDMRRMISTELAGIIRPKLKERSAEIEAKMTAAVERAFSIALEVVAQEVTVTVERMLQKLVNETFDHRKLGLDSYSVLGKVRTAVEASMADLRKEQK